MSARTDEIAAELRRIQEGSPEDIAVLMAPLIKALDRVPARAGETLGAAQLATMANSLAQVAAQSGDPDTAIAIASIQAEIETLSDDELADPPAPAPSHPQDADATPAGPSVSPQRPAEQPAPVKPFKHPLLQLAGAISIGALSYAGYLAIEAQFQPGSVASWVLTVSSTLLAVSVGLRWRRYVLCAPKLAMSRVVTAALALVAGLAAVYSTLSFRPGLRLPMTVAVPKTVHVPALANAGSADAGSTELQAADGLPANGGQGPASSEQPIAMWWMGDAEPVLEHTRPTRVLATPSTGGGTSAPSAETRGTDPAADGGAGPHDTRGSGARRARRQPSQPATPEPARPPTREERLMSMLDEDVVLTDNKGVRHNGTLIEVSKDGVTLRTEVMMFGNPILAQRAYLFSNIRTVRPD